MWCFSCFKPSIRHDSSEDIFEANTIRALKLSRDEEEDRIRCQKREEDEKNEINRAKEESLKLAEEEEAKRRLQDSKEKGKRKQAHDVNPPHSICSGGKSMIGDGIYANPQRLCCLHCHKPIAMHEISKRGKFHRHCYKEHRHPDCYICKKKIPQTEEGIKYNEHAFWKEKYCPCHDDDGTAKCCSCERLEARGTNYVMLGDDRWLCLDCIQSSVMDTYECHSLHLEIREFFEGLFFKVEKEFPLLLVEKQALNKAEEEEKIDYHRASVTRGLCMSEEQIVTSIKKGTRMGEKKEQIEIIKETQSVGGCEVTGILIIYGLPRLLTGCILAHEMMHAWLRLNGYKNLKLQLEEGLCQALGLRWLESQIFPSIDGVAASSSSLTPPAVTTSKKCDDWSYFEKKFVNFCINQIKDDDSPIYSLGFKQVYQMLDSNQYNLKDTLKDIVRASKTLPDSEF